MDCHLINRIPSFVLNNRSPFSPLDPDCPNLLTSQVLVLMPLFMSLILAEINYLLGLVSVFP